MNNKDLIPAEATHPGYLIKEEIECLGINQKEAAQKLGLASNVLSELINGKRNITPVLALKFESFFGIDAEYWLRLQIKFELDTLRIKHKKELQSKEIPNKLRNNMIEFISKNAAAL